MTYDYLNIDVNVIYYCVFLLITFVYIHLLYVSFTQLMREERQNMVLLKLTQVNESIHTKCQTLIRTFICMTQIYVCPIVIHPCIVVHIYDATVLYKFIKSGNS